METNRPDGFGCGSANFGCVNGSCSTSMCKTGFKLCGNSCVASSACCNDEDCGSCKKCSANACINQVSGEDLKSDCLAGDCHTGTCNGAGVCGLDPNGLPGHECTGTCQQCQSGVCVNRPNSRVCGTTCVPSTQCCATCGVCHVCNTATGICDVTNGAACNSGSGSGGCLANGTCAKCTQPSQGNLLINPGHDRDLTGWVFPSGVPPFFFYSWSSDDVESCPFSGSLLSTTASGEMVRCVAIQPATSYNFGAWFKSTGSGQCNLRLSGASNCGASATFASYGLRPTGITQGWEQITLTTRTPAEDPGLYFSAEIKCEANATNIDQIFLTAAPGGY
jgi:hypothetical protein